jgi:hypothetical protein
MIASYAQPSHCPLYAPSLPRFVVSSFCHFVVSARPIPFHTASAQVSPPFSFG